MATVECNSIFGNIEEVYYSLKNCLLPQAMAEAEKIEERLLMRKNISEVKNLLIGYIPIKDHVDPNFDYLTYGDSADIIVAQLLKLTVGSYVFFQTSRRDYDGKVKRYITAYYCIDKILVVGKDDEEISKFKHLDDNTDRVIIVGDKNKSKILTSPLIFDKELDLELHCLHFTPEYFQKTNNNRLAISNKTYCHRHLDTCSVELLREKCEKKDNAMTENFST